ncbi:MAG: N-acetylmuramoyl-L-alanine amidase, partial [Candidatus Eremiobacteraeota bacterium]|nr:N-acetylmuramoyl-L-alanine amidase [Candidatus Eremiobacteraeota bacterium]
ATYEWHRLGEPDNRFWVDIHGARLQGAPPQGAQAEPVLSIRARQTDADTVRIALTLSGPKEVSVVPSGNGLSVAITNQDSPDAPRSGSGSIGDSAVANSNANPASSNDSPWKFSAAPKSTYVAANPKLIVIDPGHGGSDAGAVRNGVSEKSLSLDMATRLRDDLISRGWQVRMTRATDVDVYQPNDSAHDELQARCDVANNAGARLFVSVHVNSFINSGPRGTTTYISKPIDLPFARDLERRLSDALGTKDDGIIKSHLYVTLHTSMPAALIETAFLSNPDDYARLTSPAWRQKVADAIADGIGDYTGSSVGSL